MNKYSFFFFYYLLVACTILLLGSIFFVPYPYKILQIVILTPATIYLWLRLTSPETALENQWAFRFIVVIFTLSALGLGGFFMAKVEINSSTKSADLKPYLEDQIEQLKDQIASLKALPTPATLGAESDPNNSFEVLSASITPSPKPVIGTLQIMGTTDIDVHQMQDPESKVVGVALHGNNYEYVETNSNWYLIQEDQSFYGWIYSTNVKLMP